MTALPARSPSRGWRNHRLVRPFDRARGRVVATAVAGAFLAASPFVVYLVQTTRHMETRYAVEKLRDRQERLLEAERRLRIERAVLESLPSVEPKAARDAGLVPPAPGQVVVVRADAPVSASRNPGSKGPAPAVR
jgi:hypothetical protein